MCGAASSKQHAVSFSCKYDFLDSSGTKAHVKKMTRNKSWTWTDISKKGPSSSGTVLMKRQKGNSNQEEKINKVLTSDKTILIHSQQGRSRSRNRICCRTCNNAMIQVTSQEINWN